MATANQTARDKFLEARKAGVDAVTARKQAYGEIIPAQAGGVVQASAPVANPPVTPPTPTATPPQTMQGVNGETFQVAPTNAQGISTPTQPTTPSAQTPTPAPVTTPAPTATPPTPTAPVDETATIKAQNEAQMALNKQKSDLAIQERKQQEADAKLASTPTDQKGVLNALVSGATVPTQNTAAYRNAQTQYKNYQKFSTMTPSQLVSNMKMGEIDTATSQLLANNPSYIQAKQEFEKFQKNQSINKMVQSVANGATGKVQEVDHGQEASDALAKKLGINETNADAYARIVSKNPEVVQLTQTVSSITKQLNTLNTERNAVYADLKKQYPDLSASAIMTLMSSRTKQATDEIDALNSSLSLTTADLKTAMEMAKGEYEATSADITLQSDIAKEQRQMDNALALNQAEYDQKIAQQAQAMGTPELAIPSVIEQYASQGIFAQKSAQQHIADAKALIAKGGTLGEYISQMQKDFQAKDSYKAKFAPKQDTTPFQIANLGDGKAIMYNQSTGAYNVIGGSGQPVTTQQIPSIVEECRTTGSCGQGVNDYLQKLGDTRVFGNSYSEKQSKINSQEPVVGGIAVWQPTGKMAQPEYGHVGIVSAVNGDQVTITDWNWNGDNKQSTHTVPLSSIQANGGGFYVPKTQPTSQYTDQNINDLSYLAELQEKNPTQAAKDMKELGYTARDLANYKAGNVPLTDKQKTASTDIMSAISDLVTGDRYDWNDAVGKFDLSRVIGTQDAVDAEVAINNLIAKLTLPNLGVLKGPMSDKDIQFIKEASSKLATKQSNASFERNLVDAYNLAARRAGQEEIKKLADIGSNTTQTQSVGGEVDYSKYE